MKKNLFRKEISLLLVLCMAFGLVLGCAGCGGASAASMLLRKTEGAVTVADAEGADIAPEENLGLYSGYTVGTGAKSYAWIDLDKVKLTKLDANSAAQVTKDGKNLSIHVTSGSLFFNVTEPLAGDETMEISTSSMLVGIRGTCGWVEAPDSSTMRVYILEGKVECTAGGNIAAVNAGEMAEMTEDGDIAVKNFDIYVVPGFVVEELQADEALNGAVLEASGLDVAASPLAGYADVINQFMRGKPLYAEFLDCEADGDLELMVLGLEEDAGGQSIFAHIYRKGPDGVAERARVSGSFLSESNAVGILSLVESGGRLYLRDYRRFGEEQDYWRDYYWGPTPTKGGNQEGGEWNYVEQIGCVFADGIWYSRSYRDESGLCARAPDGYDGLISAAEYAAVQANFREVKVLISLSADGAMTVLPDSVEMPVEPEG